MNKMEQIVKSYPEVFDYLTAIHNDLLSERENFQYTLKKINEDLKLRHINIKYISGWLNLARLEHHNRLYTSWRLTDLIIELVTSENYTGKIKYFDSVEIALKSERNKLIAFFRLYVRSFLKGERN